MRIGNLLVVLGLAWALLAGCGAGGVAPRTSTLPPIAPPEPTPTATPALTSTPTPKPPATPTPTPEIPPEDMEVIREVQEAIARLAEQYSQEHPGDFKSERIKGESFEGASWKSFGRGVVDAFFDILEGLGEEEVASRLKEMLLSPDSDTQIVVIAYFGNPISVEFRHGRPYGVHFNHPIKVKVIAESNKYGTEFEIIRLYGDEWARIYIDSKTRFPVNGAWGVLGGYLPGDQEDAYAPFVIETWIQNGSVREFLGHIEGESDGRVVSKDLYVINFRNLWVDNKESLLESEAFQLEQLVP